MRPRNSRVCASRSDEYVTGLRYDELDKHHNRKSSAGDASPPSSPCSNIFCTVINIIVSNVVRFRLSNFVGMVGKFQIYSTRVQDKGTTKPFLYGLNHGRTFNMPPRPSSPPWGLPLQRFLIVRPYFPQDKIAYILLVGIGNAGVDGRVKKARRLRGGG
eukprot:scaffold35677_cov176-Amphora_coffeaeformis.AAC.1